MATNCTTIQQSLAWCQGTPELPGQYDAHIKPFDDAVVPREGVILDGFLNLNVDGAVAFQEYLAVARTVADAHADADRHRLDDVAVRIQVQANSFSKNTGNNVA